MKTIINMKKTKETKGTVVYGAKKDDALLKTAYLVKDAFENDDYPENIKVTIEDKGE